MVFVDILTGQLFAIGFAGLLIAYMVLSGYFAARHGAKNSMKAGVAPLALLGLFIFITGVWGQFVWPLPGSYNILFYDPFALAGLLLLSLAWSIYRDLDLRGTGLFAFLLGLFTIYYGYSGYSLHMTSEPLALLGLYSLFGFAGVLGCPISMLLEKIRVGNRKIEGKWLTLLALFVMVLALGSLLALYIAASAVPVHLANPP